MVEAVAMRDEGCRHLRSLPAARSSSSLYRLASRTAWHSIGDKLVSGSANGNEMPGPPRILLDLLAQPRNPHVHRPILAEFVIAFAAVQQFAPVDRLVRCRCKDS